MFNKLALAFLALLMGTHISKAQVILGESITSGGLPENTDPICEIPIYPELLTLSGHYEVGDVVSDFTLYTMDGTPYTLSNVLSEGKPVLLIGGSFTCFVYRDKISLINAIEELYGDVLNTFVVYTVEAHPYGDLSPYFGTDYPGEENFEDGVLYPQPEYYGERKSLVSIMLDDYPVDVPVVIDNPCNEFWLDYGTYPNHANMINPDGTVHEFEDWLNKYPYNTLEMLEEYFSEDTVVIPEDTIPEGPVGIFEIGGFDEACITGDPGMTLIAHVELVNSDDADAFVEIQKLDEDFPDGWLSSICTDVCYPPDVLSSTILVPADSSVSFTYYFYTNENAGEGEALLLIHHLLVPDVLYPVTLKACTEYEEEEPTSIQISVAENSWSIFPNPTTENFVIQSDMDKWRDAYLQVFNLKGEMVFESTLTNTAQQVSTTSFSKGLYMIRLLNANGETAWKQLSIQ